MCSCAPPSGVSTWLQLQMAHLRASCDTHHQRNLSHRTILIISISIDSCATYRCVWRRHCWQAGRRHGGACIWRHDAGHAAADGGRQGSAAAGEASFGPTRPLLMPLHAGHTSLPACTCLSGADQMDCSCSSALWRGSSTRQSLCLQAALAIKSNAEVQQRLGGKVEVQQPFAQESSTSSVNGRMSQQVGLALADEVANSPCK